MNSTWKTTGLCKLEKLNVSMPRSSLSSRMGSKLFFNWQACRLGASADGGGETLWDTHSLGRCWEGQSSPVSPKPAGSRVCTHNVDFTDRPRRPKANNKTNRNKVSAWNWGQVNLATVPLSWVWWILTRDPSSRNSIWPVSRSPRSLTVGTPSETPTLLTSKSCRCLYAGVCILYKWNHGIHTVFFLWLVSNGVTSKIFAAYILYVSFCLLLRNIVGHLVTDKLFLLLGSGPEYAYTATGLSILSLVLWPRSFPGSQNMALNWMEGVPILWRRQS